MTCLIKSRSMWGSWQGCRLVILLKDSVFLDILLKFKRCGDKRIFLSYNTETLTLLSTLQQRLEQIKQAYQLTAEFTQPLDVYLEQFKPFMDALEQE